MESLRRTSLHESHIALNAKMAEFAGYDMPIQYTSVKEEVEAVRKSAGMFDVSHMGEFFCEGPDAVKFVDYLMTNDFAGAPVGKAVYSPLCRGNGTVIDDLIAYKLEKEKVLICVNAANIMKDYNWMITQIEGFDCTFNNLSKEYSLIALQGPESEKILSAIGFDNLNELEYYGAIEITHNNEEVILARTGYTGEDGFEIFTNHKHIQVLWKELTKEGVAPCGLAARDVLRIEVGYPLYGHEINDEVTPLDAALKWTVKLNKENFVGKEALSTLKPKFQLVKLSLEKGIPREGYPILNSEGEVIGIVTSGTMSVTTGKGIALCRIEKEKFPENKEFSIQIRKNIINASYHTKAFVNGGHK